MDFFRLWLTAALLLLSLPSHALFMPEGFVVSTETTVSSEDGCGVIAAEKQHTSE